MEAERRDLNISELLRSPACQSWIRQDGEAELGTTLHRQNDPAVAVDGGTRAIDQGVHATS